MYHRGDRNPPGCFPLLLALGLGLAVVILGGLLLGTTGH